ncbi:lactonase family protein [Lapidilactobacillus luobeiensis]|uniref:lactonase family protein n=1 Tax=Lapidilactobacillus luobeiensis TaxID=2950371 RepID=UPI0021C39F5A|nr:lactonase family protein [Lapidilactobacillus luobeiensis]
MKEKILFGGYTRRGGQGIYAATLDTDQEVIDEPRPFIKVGQPTYLAISHDRVLYTVTKDGEAGGVSAYDLSGEQPRLINQVTAAGSPPAYVAVDEPRQLVYAANYHKGQVQVYRILANGGLELASVVNHVGQGPRPEQDSAHVHFTDLTPDQRLAVCDLGIDELITYDVSSSGDLTKVASYRTEAGYGPRHLVFAPNGRIAYLLGELSSKVQVLAYHPDGHFSLITNYSLIPDDYTDFNGSAAIRISRDGKFLYASNRGHNSITVFAVTDNGRDLNLIQRISSEGDFPRDFDLDPSERFVVCANQNTDNSTLYRRNPETGLLTKIQQDINTPESVCVLFL